MNKSGAKSKQQSTFSNEGIFIYSKLWQRTKDRNRCKKKGKNKEGSRVCRKNKEDIRGSRSSVEKNIEEDEVTSKQEEEQS